MKIFFILAFLIVAVFVIQHNITEPVLINNQLSFDPPRVEPIVSKYSTDIVYEEVEDIVITLPVSKKVKGPETIKVLVCSNLKSIRFGGKARNCEWQDQIIE